jgi:hypothetical protein
LVCNYQFRVLKKVINGETFLKKQFFEVITL